MSTNEAFVPVTPFQAKPGRAFRCSEVEITAERVRLLPISEDYAREIFKNFTPEVTYYMVPQPADCIDDTLAFINNARRGMEREENLQFVIVDKASGEFLGCCGLHGHGCPTTPELGIWLKEVAHGRRYGREAITAVKRWVDEHLRYSYLTYPVDRENIPSRKIPESLGGEIHEESLCPTRDGRFLDIVIYRIYADVAGQIAAAPSSEEELFVPLTEIAINQACPELVEGACPEPADPELAEGAGPAGSGSRGQSQRE
ncbi:MAG: GNAT family N-acetyltransferase [Candidatus Promineifilaceae bacterium]